VIDQAPPADSSSTPPAPPAADAAGAERVAIAALRSQVARVLELDGARLPPERSLVSFGLDSLSAAELAAAIESELGVQVPLATLLEGVSLAELAEEVERRLMAPPPVVAAPPAAADAGTAGPDRGRGPLSPGQRALWLLDQMAPGNPAYIIAGAGRVRGRLDRRRLKRALAALVARHPALRTTFDAGGAAAVQVVQAEARFAFTFEDATTWSEARLAERLSEEAYRPFDLASGPLLRIGLWRCRQRRARGARGARGQGGRESSDGRVEHLLMMAVHHIVVDFWSAEVLLAELGALYDGRSLPPLAVSYGDFVRRQTERLAGPEGERLEAYWRAALPPGAPPLELPTDRPRPGVPSLRGGARTLGLGRALTAALHALGRQAGATPFMTLLAAFQVLLHRYSGQEEVRVGTPTSGRSSRDLAGLVGYFVNPVVMRGNLAGSPSFATLLDRVRETALGAFAHQDYPFPLLAERLGGERDPSRPPVFQAMLVLYRERPLAAGRGPGTSPGLPGGIGAIGAIGTIGAIGAIGAMALGVAGSRVDLGGLAVEPVPLTRRGAQVDLTLLAAEIEGALTASLQFSSDLFDAVTAGRMLAQLRTLAAAAAADPARNIRELPLLGDSERQQLLEWNDTAGSFRPATAAGAGSGLAFGPEEPCLHQLFELQARRVPGAVAAIADADGDGDGDGDGGIGESITYAALNARANRLARRLREQGVGPESVVAICAERSLALVAGLLAILKAGGAYLPLDPDYPADRQRFMLEDSGARVLLAQRRLLARLGTSAAGTVTLDLDEAPVAGGERRRRSRRPEASELDSTGAESGGGPDNLAYVIYTSGSTGRPKGTMNTHRGIVNRLLWMQERYRLAADDRVLQKTPISFDVSVWELFWPLITGASLVLARPGGHRDAAYLLDTLDRQQITTVHFVPAMLRAFLAEAGQHALPPARRRLPRLRRVMASGEALPWELQQAYFARFAAPLHNLYGPTEAAVDVTHWQCDADGQRVVPIGRPVANTSIRLLDRDGQEVPIGVAGELHIGGVQLARGYLGRTALTAQRFVPDPFAAAPGSRLYRTGDLARYLPDGAVDFLGRRDDQVKIRGVRVELGEIEAVLAAHPAVAAAAVGLRPVERPAGGAGAEAPGEQRLVAWVVARGGPAAVPGGGGAAGGPAAAPSAPSAPSVGELRRALAAKLPDAMVPAAFVFLERLPLTPSGKLDRRALPSPAERADRPVTAAAGDAPIPSLTPAEELLAGLWTEVLGVATIAANDDFFALGGHSLLATRLSSRVRELFGVELPMRRVFERPTLEALAREIAAMTAGSAAAPAGSAAGPIPRRPDGEERVLSYPQERLWFLDQLAPGSAAYNLPGALRLTGRLDPEAFGRSLGEIVRRHEVLRSAYPAAADWPVPVVWPHRAHELPLVDLSALGAAAAGTGHELGGQLGHRPFDLARGPLVRTALVRLAPDRHLLILVLHHIIADGWSVKVFLRELAALYAAFAGERRDAAGPLPELSLQYFDFARWQRRRLTGELLGAQLAYWRQALGSAPSHLALPADRPRPAVPSPRGARISQQLPSAETAELHRAAGQSGATLFMSLLAAFAALLHRATGEPDLVVGTPIANREQLELEGLIGCFVNTLALRADLSGRPSFRDLLERVRQVCLAAYANQDLPFEQLVEALAPRRDLAWNPLFQVMLVLQSTAGGGRHATAAQLAMELCDVEITAAKFDLTLDASETAQGLTLTFEYRRDLFDAATVRRWARQFQALLAATVAEPGREIAALPLMGAAERQQLLEWNDTAAAWRGHVCLHELFEEQARRIPEAVAVVALPPEGADGAAGADGACKPASAGESLTYGALDARAGRLARHLRELGAGPETVVAISAERSLALVVGLVAILKAGAAYLPLDPDYPGERLRFMLRDAAAPVVLAQRALLPRLGGPVTGAATVWLDDFVPGRAGGSVHPDSLASRVQPGNLAYVIYTSGSTGQPKGTMNTHRGIVNRLRWGQERYRLAADDRVLQKTPFSFDVSVWELFWPLTAGACLVLARPGGHRDSAYLVETLAAQAITTVHFVPAMLSAFLEGAGLCPVEHDDGIEGGGGSASPPPARLPGLRRVLSSGEALGSELQQRFHAALAVPLHNLYGPTEAAVEVTSWSCEQPRAAAGAVAPPPAWAAAEAVRSPGVPIGRPVANTRIQLLDREGWQVPIGVAGELCIGGVQLARGYLGRPALTAERFVPDPFGEPAGARLYRTGDLARYLPDGAIDYLGRLDQQVKIRGVRVELGEIEAALTAHPAVQAAAVVLRPVARPDGGQCGPAAAASAEHRLVAFLVARHEPGPAAEDAPAAGAAADLPRAADLRASLAARLPEAMVPAAYVFVARLPLTPSGKIDRKALSGPTLPPTLAGAAAAPEGRGALRTPAEELLAGLWAQMLGVEAIRSSDSFFALGGHSLLVTRLISRVRRAFGVELPMRRVFEHPTLSELAAEISAVLGAGGAGAGAELAGPAFATGGLAGGQEEASLSFSQERFWLLDQLTQSSAAYNLSGGLRLRGRLEVPALARSLNQIVRRHQVLRSIYPAARGRPVQVVLPRLAVQLPVVDLSALAGAADAAGIALGARLGRQPFDLATGPLLRATLLRLSVPGGGEEPSPAAAEHLLVLTLHHIVGDGWSVTIFLRELAAFYAAFAAGEPPALAELPIQYSDFVRWQRARLTGEVLAAQLAYWRQALAEAPAQLALPADRPRPPVQSFRGAAISRMVPPELTAALRRTARQGGATLFMTLLAVLDVLLHRVSGQDDLVVGAPIANRERLDIEGLIGCFVNTLALRSDLGGLASSLQGSRPGFPELLAAVREVSLGAYAHQEMPFEKLVETLAPRRDLATTPLFQVALALQNATTVTSVEVPAGAAGPPGAHRDSLTMEFCELPIETAKFDLLVQAAETPTGLALSFEFSRDLFDVATVRRLAEQYCRLLAAVATGAASPPRSIDELPLLGAGERHQLLAEWSGAATAYPRESLVHELFAAQVLRRPDAVAVAAGAEQLTYGEIHRRSNRLARRLRRLGVGPEALVAVALPRSPAMVVALLGTLKSGGAYLPLDPGLPWPRQQALLAETRARVLPLGGGRELDGESEADLEPREVGAGPESLAYVMFTSGSSGAPKGVAVVHRGVVRLVREAGFADCGSGQVWLHVAPLAFDASTLEIWGPLLGGGRLELFAPGPPDLRELGEALRRGGVTTLFLTAGLFHQMVESRVESLGGLRQLLSGGDVLSAPHVRRALQELPGCLLVNAYGPTENTTITSCHRMTAAPEAGATSPSVPIGRPIGNSTVYLWDRQGQAVPVGVPGELVTGGDGLARGYLGGPDLTAERFVPDPFAGGRGGSGGRLYRTGDLARWLPSGQLEFLGRIDRQVKIRGFRIEPGEVEAQLARHPGVEQSMVAARRAGPDDRRLVAWVVARPGSQLTSAGLRGFLAERLADHAVPAAVVLLAALPLTANGKVDRDALPEPEWLQPPRQAELPVGQLAARTPVEELLAGFWAELLGPRRPPTAMAAGAPERGAAAAGGGGAAIGPGDDFFALGGHSLLATRLVSRVREELGVELPLRRVFEHPTLAAMAREVAGAIGDGADLARPTLSLIPRRLPPVRLPESHDDLVLSYAQERIWFLAQLAPDSTAYNVAGALRFSGALSPARLAGSLDEIVRRHAVLRSAYPLAAGRPSPVVSPPRAVELPLIDLAPLGEAAAATGRALGASFGRRPFDLATGPLLRAALLRLDPEQHLLVLVLHHIVADGWSVTVFLRELAALYAAGPLPELPIQYFDFARWQRERLTGEALAPQLAYWRQALAGPLCQLALPADRPRPPVPDLAGACVRELVPSAVTAALHREALEGGATLFMVLLAAFDVLLCRYTGQLDLVVGTPIANRDRLDIEGLIGCFVNTLALRADLAGRPSFHGLLLQVRQTCLAAYANQELPFEKLVEALAPRRDLDTTPFFQVMLVLQSATTAARQRPTPDLEIELGELDATAAKLELTIDAREGPRGLALSFEYRTGLFDAVTVKRLAGHFQSLLAAVGAGTHRGLDIATLPLLGEGERQQLLWEWNDTAAHPGDRLLHQLFEEQARRAPDAVAVLAETAAGPEAGAGVETLTYGTLEARANRLAADLRRLGVGPESVVAICAERSAVMVAALLAILKAGAAYLPLDPGYPAERLRFMLRDSGARVLVASPNLPGCRRLAPGRRSLPWLGEAAAGVTTVWLDPEPARRRRPGRGRWRGSSGLQPDNLAYVIYTSGSTGQPKGTMNTHRGIVNRLLWMQERHRLAATDRVLQKTPLSFDVSVWELFWPLATGACLVMARPEGHRDSAYLRRALARHEITNVHFVPAMLSAFLDGADRAERPAGSRLPSLRRVMASGEALSYELQQQYYAALDAPLHNLYGPTEAAVEVTSWATERAGPRRLVPIGRPVANTRLRVLDHEGRQLPIGVPGELCIGGVQLARGYLGRPELTAERFVPDPVGPLAPLSPLRGAAGARLYRTGDLARYLPDGAIDYLGRLDHQVKIRGVRIEPGEIEAALVRHPGVREAVVTMAAPVEPGSPADLGPRLVAYLVPRQPSPAADPAGACLAPEAEAALIDDLRGSLRRSLPEAMVPAAFVVLGALPLSANGKVDRKALPAPRWGGGSGAVRGRVAPRTPDEEILTGLFASLLGLEVARGDGRGEVGIHESFFDLGGHSLLVTRLLARVREVFQVELPLRKVFEDASVAALAAAIAAVRQGGLLAAAIPRVPPPPLPPEARGRPLPLSFAQERLWFIDQLEPGSPAYNMPFALRLTGALRVAALAAGLGEVRRRHEVFRTRIVAGAGGGARPVAVVAAVANSAAPTESGELRRIDLAGLPASRRAAEAARLRAAEARRPFDLAAGPLLRTVLLRLDGGAPAAPPGPAALHELLLTLHHVVGDGWSIEVLARELAALYAAGVSGLPPAPGALPELPIQYADFAHWQRERLTGERLAAELDFWREQLAGPRGAPPPLELPGDRPAAAAASRRGARRGFALAAAIAGDLTALARRHGATLFMTLLAAFDVLLGRHGGQEDVAVGVPVANRDRPEVQNLIGLFVNTLVLRLDLSGDPGFLELMGRARQAALAVYAHQEVPFEQLVAELAPRREAGETPFFQALLALQPELAPPSMPGLVVEHLESDTGTAKFELSLAVAAAAGGGLAGSWTYRAGRFEPATIERLSGQLRELLRAVAAAPERRLSELPLLGEAERHQLLVEWNGGWEPGGDDLVHAPFERQASRHPDAVALAARGADGRSELALTYGELASQSERLACLLRGLGVGPEQVVGICVEPSFDLVVGLLGVLKAGGAYLPLDPSHPRDRQAQILADSAARVVLADGEAVERLQGLGGQVLLASPAWLAVAATGPGGEGGAGTAERGIPYPAPPPSPPLPPQADNTAYVLYTSGSTGAPKGVVTVHRAVVNRLRFQVAADLEPGARVLQRARLAFDVSVVELFAPLWMGGTVVLAAAARRQEAGYLANLIEVEQVTNANAPPALLPALLAEEALRRCRSLRRVVTGGERVPADLLPLFDSAMAAGTAKAGRTAPPALLVSRYGPTEATVSVTEWSGRADACTGPTVPLGWPIAGARFYVLGRDQRELPPGAQGELCIAGLCLARGYLGRPDLTAAAFVPDPFAGAGGEAGGRLYRTGDLARWRADGVIEFLGRIDRQVKIRGFRLELGEVEAALARHPEVGEVAVVDRDEPATGGKRLVAYVVRRVAAGTPSPAAAPLDPRQLRTFVAAQLPPYMVPAAYVTLERLPLTANGKLDRQALPAPSESAGLGGEGATRTPRTPAERLLAGFWSELLGVRQVGADDDFFELGGHSLLATQLVSRVRGELGVELPLRRVFERPTLSGLARELSTLLPPVPAGGSEPPDLAGMAAAVAGVGGLAGLAEAAAMPPILAVPRDRELPLSFAQERLWFLEQLRPGTPTYNIASTLRLRGALDRAALAAALAGVVRRHETLRTTFAVRGGRPVVRIAPAMDGALPLVDLSRLPMTRRARTASGLADRDAATPFDLAARPAVRACLLWLGRGATSVAAAEAAEHWLLLAVHHIAADGWSVGVLLGELTELYGAAQARRPARLPELPVQYADFACWQRDWLQGDVLRRRLDYWRERLRGAPPLTSPPADRPRPALQRWAGEVRPVRFDAALAGELRAAARAQKVTLFMLLAAALDLVLLRQIGRPDLVLGTPIAGRTRTEVEGLIGLFLNSLALRVQPVAEEGLAALLGQVREVTLGAYAHQELPFEQLVEELAPERSLSQSPLFQVMLVLQNAPWRELRLPGVEAAAVAIDNRSAKVDLTLSLHEAASGLEGVCRYNRDLFDGATVGRLMQQLETLLRAALADPERPLAALPLLSRAERRQLLDWNDTTVRWGEAGCLHQLLAAQARRSPEAPAVGFAGEWLSYGELDGRANGLAHRLRTAGVGPEVLVGLCVERSAEMMVGVLAVLKAGGAYLPLDPSYPRERLAFMLEEAAVPVLLTQQRLVSGLGASAATVICLDAPGGAAPPAAEGPEVPVDPDNLAYVIYTSGSTGRPKGAMNTHRAIVNRLSWMQSAFGLEASDRVVQKTPLSFDVSVWELFWPLLCGAGLVVARPGGHQDTDYLLDLIARERVTTVHFVPSMLRALLDAPDLSGAGGLRRVVASGEVLPAELLARYRERLAVPLYNLYGPTEAAVDVTAWECLPAVQRRAAGASDPGRGLGGVPIGRPIANTTIQLLDAALRPVPVGVPGELYIGGVQPARGYLRRPGLTAERFVPDPESGGGGASAPGAPPGGGRLYRTGDLARYLPDGAIDFLGRSDHQVKIRGFRIELGEIEARLARHQTVAAAAVVARGSGAAAQLVAYVVPRPGSAVERDELRRWLAASLPEHMLPSAWVELSALPLTPSGKIDRRALPEPAASGAAQSELVMPRTPLERYLADLWRDALPAASFGIADNFFALGGNSLSGAMLIYRLQEKLGEIVHVVTLFDAPTIAGLAAHLAAEHPRAVARLWGGEGGEGDDGAAAASEPAAAGRVDRAQVARLRQLLGARVMQPAAAPEVAGKRNPPAVFVLSPPRSGSTLLRVMLAGHSRLFAPPELELLSYRTLAERRRALSGRDAFRREGAVRALMEIRGCAATEALGLIAGCEDAGWSTRRFYGLLQQDLGERLLVDKTPTYAWDRQALRRAEEDFAGPLYVHLVRHPCATIRSFTEAKLDQIFFGFFGAGHPFTRRELAELSWTVAHQNILELRGEVPPERWHTVSFEQLVREPGRVLAAVCAFLGLAYEPAMARPYESRPGKMIDGIHAQSRMLGDVKFHSHRQVDAGAGKRSWDPAAEAALGEPTRETASALGIALARGEERATLPANLVGLQPGDGRRPPLVLIHPVFGDVQIYRHLARELGPDQPVYGFQTPALTGGTVPERLEEMAAQYLEALLTWRPAGPYLLAGSSMGGCIAFEMARQLTAGGQEVALLALLDSWAGEPLARAASAAVPAADEVDPQAAFLAWLTGGDERTLGRELAGLDGESRLALLLDRARRAGGLPASYGSADLLRLLAAIDGQRRALHLYEPGPYSGRVLFLRAAEGLAGHPEATWRRLAHGGLEIHRVPGGHRSMFLPPHVATTGRLLTAAIRAIAATIAGIAKPTRDPSTLSPSPAASDLGQAIS
jgi:amino acid adenylation domain-containing protein